MRILPPVSIEARRLLPGPWDLLAAVLVLGFIVLLADASQAVIQPLSNLNQKPISLDPSALPGYALRTGLRMLVALGFSLLFTFSYATWAAKSPRAGTLLVPLLDILQSVPILGFISVTFVFFLSLAPGRIRIWCSCSSCHLGLSAGVAVPVAQRHLCARRHAEVPNLDDPGQIG